MAQLAVSIISNDDQCKREMARLLRASGVPIGIVEERRNGDSTTSDVYIIDIRADASSGMATIERLRAAHAGVAIFAIAASAEPDLILQAMRAGANEFFPWAESGVARSTEESFQGAIRKTAARRDAAIGADLTGTSAACAGALRATSATSATCSACWPRPPAWTAANATCACSTSTTAGPRPAQ